MLPHLPEEGSWSIAEVVDNEYRYEIDPELGDYGHIRNVRLLNPDSPINPYSEAVSAALRNTMRYQGRLWNIDQYEEEMQRLLAALEEGAPVGQSQSEEEKLESIKNALKEQLWEQLKRWFQSAEFEKPCRRLLGLLYDEVRHTAGRQEHGADFICSFADGLGVPHNVAVQLKMWMDERGGDLSDPVKQIREAYRYYDTKITSAVILTTLDDITDDSRYAIDRLSEELGIPVQVVRKDDLLELFLRHLSAMTGALDQPLGGF